MELPGVKIGGFMKDKRIVTKGFSKAGERYSRSVALSLHYKELDQGKPKPTNVDLGDFIEKGGQVKKVKVSGPMPQPLPFKFVRRK